MCICTIKSDIWIMHLSKIYIIDNVAYLAKVIVVIHILFLVFSTLLPPLMSLTVSKSKRQPTLILKQISFVDKCSLSGMRQNDSDFRRTIMITGCVAVWCTLKGSHHYAVKLLFTPFLCSPNHNVYMAFRKKHQRTPHVIKHLHHA